MLLGSSSPAAGEEEAAGQRRSFPVAAGCPASLHHIKQNPPEHSNADAGRQREGRKDGSHMEAAGVPWAA